MLVHQCNSCGMLSPKGYNNGMPEFPENWGRVTVDVKIGSNAVSRSKITYDLCNECVSLPITFGTIELNRNSD